jgi:hypothetical protein
VTLKVGDVSCALVDKKPEEINSVVKNKGFKMSYCLDVPLNCHCFPFETKSDTGEFKRSDRFRIGERL